MALLLRSFGGLIIGSQIIQPPLEMALASPLRWGGHILRVRGENTADSLNGHRVCRSAGGFGFAGANLRGYTVCSWHSTARVPEALTPFG